jgi:predicted ATPase
LTEALLGTGGMGEVYRARDMRLGRIVAIKVVRSQWAGRGDFRQRLEREACAISVLNHPHICTLYDIGEQDGTPYLVMEYLEGQTLASQLREGPLAFDRLLQCGREAAAALAMAHARGIVHRDLKPSNLMLTPLGLKILDFGLAKSTGPVSEGPVDQAVSSSHALAGTPAYMSPEQSRGETLDNRSDIFSLGCVLYEAATGCAPFRGASILSILHEIASASPPAASGIRPELPLELDLILERMLAKDKGQRYGSASEVDEALAALQSSPRATLPAIPEREPEPLVGREPEIRKLEQLLDHAREGTGKITLVLGAAGIGKTALIGTFLFSQRHRQPEILIGRGSCIEQYGTGEAYLPFLEALSSLLQGSTRERVMMILRRHAPTWCLQFPSAVTSTSGIDHLQRETIGATKERMLREFGDALSALSSVAPVVLLLEDLHWADPFSVDLLRHLGQRAPGQRFLVIGTARAEDVERSQHPLLNCKRELVAHGACEEIQLAELGCEHIARLMDIRFAPNSFTPEFKELIYRKTEGHPLFAAGALQLLSDKGGIAQRNGIWGLVRPLSEMDLEVPASVQSMIRKQLEAVTDADRQVLQFASVEGIEFTSTVLVAVLRVDELELEERLDALDRVHRLIQTIGNEELPDGSLATRYRFAHALYQNTLYEDLLTKRRILLHRQAGETLARCYRGQTARIAAVLAAHFESGREFAKAIDSLIEAAGVAMGRYANAAAEAYYSHALLLSEKLAAEEQSARRGALYNKRGAVRILLARYPEAVQDFAEVLGLARSLKDLALECTALNGVAHAHFWTHRLDQLGICAEKAMRLADQIGDPSLQAEARVNLARKYQGTGDLETAITLYDEGIEIARRSGRHAAVAFGLAYRAVIYFFRTDYQRAEMALSEAAELAADVRNGLSLLQALMFLGLTRVNLGRISEGLATLNESAEMARRNGNHHLLARIPNSIAWVYRELQDWPRALELDRDCVRTARECGSIEAEANSLINLIHDYILLGEADHAGAALHDVEAMRDRDPWHQWRFFGIRFQEAAAQYWLWQGNMERAEQYALTLLDNAAMHRVPKYLAIAQEVLARIALTRGDSRAAESRLAMALDALREYPTPLVEWKVLATLAHSRSQAANLVGGRQAFESAAAVIEKIASNIFEPKLRSVFLNSPAVREAVAGGSHGLAAAPSTD